MAKYKSRARRAAEVASTIRAVTAKLEDLRDKAQELQSEVESALGELDLSEVSGLLDEMSEWRDNMEEKLSATPKYEEVSRCCSELEDIDSEAPDAEDLGALQEVIDDLNGRADALEGISFPSAF